MTVTNNPNRRSVYRSVSLAKTAVEIHFETASLGLEEADVPWLVLTQDEETSLCFNSSLLIWSGALVAFGLDTL